MLSNIYNFSIFSAKKKSENSEVLKKIFLILQGERKVLGFKKK